MSDNQKWFATYLKNVGGILDQELKLMEELEVMVYKNFML